VDVRSAADGPTHQDDPGAPGDRERERGRDARRGHPGEPCYSTLTAAARDHAIDVVDVFRRSEFAGAVVDEAIPLRPRLIWLQVGVVDEAACDRAAAAAIPCVMDRCLMVEHRLVQV